MRPAKGVGWRKILGTLPKIAGVTGIVTAGYMGTDHVIRARKKQLQSDQKVSTFNKLQNVNTTNMMEGNRTEYMFRAAKNGARRHKNMGYN